MTKLYFAYGANLDQSNMAGRCPNAVPFKKLVLPDWQLQFNYHATIMPCPGSSVQGAVWILTDKCEAALDLFEGYPTYYDKQVIATEIGDLMVYIMQPDMPCAPSVNYVNTIARGYQDWDLDIDCLWEAVDASAQDAITTK